jgi:hypothetical protein
MVFSVQDKRKVANPGYTCMSPFWRKIQLVPTHKKELKRRAHDLKNQVASEAKAGSNSRIQFASNESILIP